RENDYKVTAVVNGTRLIALEPGDTTDSLYGLAVDVGTTTVAGMLIDLNTGKWLASASRTNPQTKHGDDVVSRIDFSSQPEGLQDLGTEIHECLNDIITELLKQTGLKKEDIYGMSVAGNTTMSHLFFQIPCINIAQAPYVPAFRQGFELPARNLGIEIHPEGCVHAIPNIAGFVGADTVAAILASGMHESERMQLLVDIGTNGEIALGNKDRIEVCSTAAGPAFEGARLTFGMRGTEGAIEKVVINHSLHLDVIGNQKPQGICGSGVIDLLGEMLKAGLVDETGRIVDSDEIPESLPESLRNRIISGKNGNEFVLVERESQPPIVFSQRDIREVQLAKAAIFAGIQVLLSAFGIQVEDLDAILLAGAFGNYIRRHQAKQIGLLPNIPEEKIKFIGNAAIEGAMRVLLSKEERDMAKTISDGVNYIELSARPDFQDHYMTAMMFMD
ncbi:DUF4445 domain-containing protein, partial [bacterium]|nr:DUF4445 domain-containing protein [bacterium]